MDNPDPHTTLGHVTNKMENTTKKLKRWATQTTSKIEGEIYYFQFSLLINNHVFKLY